MMIVISTLFRDCKTHVGKIVIAPFNPLLCCDWLLGLGLSAADE